MVGVIGPNLPPRFRRITHGGEIRHQSMKEPDTESEDLDEEKWWGEKMRRKDEKKRWGEKMRRKYEVIEEGERGGFRFGADDARWHKKLFRPDFFWGGGLLHSSFARCQIASQMHHLLLLQI